MVEDEERNNNYQKGDLLYIVYTDGETGDRKAKGPFLAEDETSITIDIGGYILRIFKNVIIKIEQPKNNSRGKFNY
jgi:hypothetical protein